MSEKKDNGIGIAGFVLALIAFFLGWIPIVGWILWILGIVFSSVGLTKKHIGFAVTGLFLSVFSLILIIGIFYILQHNVVNSKYILQYLMHHN